MDEKEALIVFRALSQETRLKALRLLIESGADGVRAGEIAERLDVPHNTLSSHLGELERAGLIFSRREGRSIRYMLNISGLRQTIDFLMRDCCRGRPEICAPLLDDLPSSAVS